MKVHVKTTLTLWHFVVHTNPPRPHAHTQGQLNRCLSCDDSGCTSGSWQCRVTQNWWSFMLDLLIVLGFNSFLKKKSFFCVCFVVCSRNLKQQDPINTINMSCMTCRCVHAWLRVWIQSSWTKCTKCIMNVGSALDFEAVQSLRWWDWWQKHTRPSCLIIALCLSVFFSLNSNVTS